MAPIKKNKLVTGAADLRLASQVARIHAIENPLSVAAKQAGAQPTGPNGEALGLWCGSLNLIKSYQHAALGEDIILEVTLDQDEEFKQAFGSLANVAEIHLTGRRLRDGYIVDETNASKSPGAQIPAPANQQPGLIKELIAQYEQDPHFYAKLALGFSASTSVNFQQVTDEQIAAARAWVEKTVQRSIHFHNGIQAAPGQSATNG